MSSFTLTEETIREMARLTILSNRINSLQEKNLKHFPLIAFNGVSTVRIDYDFSPSKQEEGEKEVVNEPWISYYLNIDAGTQNDHMEKRFAALEQWSRQLLWKSLRVEIYVNDIEVYKSAKDGK